MLNQLDASQHNFAHLEKFDQSAAATLAEFFDLNYAEKNLQQFQVWHQNLSVLASQNLGLAHCVLHNQTARNHIAIAYSLTGHSDFDRPYSRHVGSFTSHKGSRNFYSDTMHLHGHSLSGKKHWASQLDTADFIIMRVGKDNLSSPVTVFLDLTTISHEKIASASNPLGLEAARPFDLVVNGDIADHWLMTPDNIYEPTILFHYWGLVGNYFECSQTLMQQARNFPNNLSYHIKKLELDLHVLKLLRSQNLAVLLEPFQPAWTNIMLQYQFARKTLVNIVGFFLEIFNSGMADKSSSYSVPFRNALTMAAHLMNLYNQVALPIKF